MKKLLWIFCILSCRFAIAQNVGIHTTTPQSSLDVRGNLHLGGASRFMSYDTASGRIVWTNSHLFVPVTQYLVRHSASSEGLVYDNAQLSYVNATGNPVFSTNWNTGNTYARRLGIDNNNPQYPLSFNSDAGEKISLWSDGITSTHYGIGIQNGLMQLYANTSVDAIGFGYGSSYGFTELVRVNGGANLDVYRGTAPGGTAQFYGTQNVSHFNFGSNEDTYIRAGKDNRYVILNDIAGGRVGVGTATPSETLDVNGNVKAQQFKFATPKTSYYSIDFSAFSQAAGAPLHVEKYVGHGAYISNSEYGSVLIAPVNLPHNAIMTGFTVYYYDNSVANDLYTAISRRDNSQFRLIQAGVTSSGAPGLSSSIATFVSADPIDNINYSYVVECLVTGPGSAWPSNGDLKVKRVVVSYTVNEAD